MKYVSTRGSAPELSFSDALLTGLARDGGLYVPAQWPTLSPEEIAGFAGKTYQEVAFRVMSPFIGDAIPAAEFRRIIDAAYAQFDHRAITPLRQIGCNDWILELSHGPTLAFKDVAMQLLARLFDHVLAASGRRLTIVGATSGDTGSAAIEAFRGRDAIDIFIMHPDGKVSEVQRRQMTTVLDANVHNIAIDGSFDDCQALVKDMFNDHRFREDMHLAGVNSINWGRVLAQIVYYFVAGVALGAPQRPISFSVPTGNFGDIYAGHVARKMGLPIENLIIATNVNDILARTLAEGRYEVGRVTPTLSPSMDIQVSSNFERLLFEAYEGDGAQVVRLMQGLKQSGAFQIAAAPLQRIRAGFSASRVDEDTTLATISQTFAAGGALIDPHTAVGIAAAAVHRGNPATPMITLSTADPAKFPAAVERATSISPALPPRLQDLFEREERYVRLKNDVADVEAYVRTHSRVAATA